MKRKTEYARVPALALALVAAIALSGCGSRPAPAPATEAPAAAPRSTDTPVNEGGLSGDEPTGEEPTITAPSATANMLAPTPGATALATDVAPTATATDAPSTATIAPPSATPMPAANTSVPTPVPATNTPAPTAIPTATVAPAGIATAVGSTALGTTPAAAAQAAASTPAAAAPATGDWAAATAAAPGFVPSQDPYPLQIEVMRQQNYPGSEITFEQTLQPGANYSRYLVSYRSEGYKIYALMTVPDGPKPESGWPAIIFNHGYIPPRVYRTTERYVAYVDAIARSGYIVFKSDYRGHGSSEGPPEGAYGFPGYTADVLNALSSVKAYKDADPNRIGMWGHSLGGSITLRSMVVSKDIKAGAIWGGVVAPYPNLFARDPNRPRTGTRPTSTPVPPGRTGPYGRPWRQELTARYGTVEQNPAFWASISPNSYLADISGPVQLNHSVTDEEVPVAASEILHKQLQEAGKTVELYTYPGDNHNISRNFGKAMQRTIAFFDQYVKGATAD